MQDNMPPLPSAKDALGSPEADLLSPPELPPPPPPPPKVPAGIEVRAIANGFIHNHRKVPGDVFQISSAKELGSWMECTNPRLEKQHQEIMKTKKLEQRKKAEAGK